MNQADLLRIIELRGKGLTVLQVALRAGVSMRTVRRHLNTKKATHVEENEQKTC